MRLVRVVRAAASAPRRPAIRMRSFTRPPQAAARKHFINAHASAQPAAEAISDRGRPQRRSVKNRKSFDCFKSAEGIRFSAGAVADPEIVSPRRFLGYLLSEQKVTDKTIMEDCDSQSRAVRRRPTRRTAVALLPPSANSLQYAECFPVIPHFSFEKKKNEWNLCRQLPICDANPHLRSVA